HAGIFEHLYEIERGQRRLRCGFEHHGVAAHERRDDLPRRDRHREIPGRDDRADPERLPNRHRELVSELRWDRLPEHAAPFAGDVEGHVDGFLHVATRFVQHLAHLAGHVARELLLALDDELRGLEEHLRTDWCRDQSPAGIRARRRLERRLHVAPRRFLKHTDQVVGIRRVAILERLTGRGRNPAAVDEVVESGDGWCRGHEIDYRRDRKLATGNLNWKPGAGSWQLFLSYLSFNNRGRSRRR